MLLDAIQDVGLPMMIDPRFEEDTLFMVFEEDFRFEDDELLPQSSVLPTPVDAVDDRRRNVPRPDFVIFVKRFAVSLASWN